MSTPSQTQTKVGIREFREKLATFVEGDRPIAVTRHGETVGVYLPVRRKVDDAERDAWFRAAEQVQAMIKAAGITEDELVEDFKAARKAAHKKSSRPR
jgi:PHD/YefM family antitoxin component YafN of YafNO toxin-antitoxin module